MVISKTSDVYFIYNEMCVAQSPLHIKFGNCLIYVYLIM